MRDYFLRSDSYIRAHEGQYDNLYCVVKGHKSDNGERRRLQLQANGYK